MTATSSFAAVCFLRIDFGRLLLSRPRLLAYVSSVLTFFLSFLAIFLQQSKVKANPRAAKSRIHPAVEAVRTHGISHRPHVQEL